MSAQEQHGGGNKVVHGPHETCWVLMLVLVLRWWS